MKIKKSEELTVGSLTFLRVDDNKFIEIFNKRNQASWDVINPLSFEEIRLLIEFLQKQLEN